MFSIDTLKFIAALAVFASFVVFFVALRCRYHVSFAIRTVAALVVGAGFEVLLQVLFGAEVKKWISRPVPELRNNPEII